MSSDLQAAFENVQRHMQQLNLSDVSNQLTGLDSSLEAALESALRGYS